MVPATGSIPSSSAGASPRPRRDAYRRRSVIGHGVFGVRHRRRTAEVAGPRRGLPPPEAPVTGGGRPREKPRPTGQHSGRTRKGVVMLDAVRAVPVARRRGPGRAGAMRCRMSAMMRR